jgi:hypothetical protein
MRFMGSAVLVLVIACLCLPALGATKAPPPPPPSSGAANPADPVPPPSTSVKPWEMPSTAPAPAPAAPPSAALPPPAPAAPPPAAAPPIPAGPTAAEIQAEEKAHFEKGETRLGKIWIPIERLLEEYRLLGGQIKGLTDRVQAAQAALKEASQKLAPVRQANAAKEQPIQAEIEKAKARQAELNKVLETPPPADPSVASIEVQLRPDGTPAPDRKPVNGSTKGFETESWVKQTKASIAEYRRQLEQYQADIAKYRTDMDNARNELSTVESTLQEQEAKLAEIYSAPEAAPLYEQVKNSEDEVKALGRAMPPLQLRRRDMEAAFRKVPEPVRLKRGIVEWQRSFWTLAELENQAAAMRADIAQSQEKVKAAAGGKLPAGYRHPSQNDLDALNLLIASVKAPPAR